VPPLNADCLPLISLSKNALHGKARTLVQAHATVGIVAAAAGVAVNLTSALFFRQAASAGAHASDAYKRLTDLENVRLSAQILSSIETGLGTLAINPPS